MLWKYLSFNPSNLLGINKEELSLGSKRWLMFDPDTVQDDATYDKPKTQPTGISLVVVNGDIGMQQGIQTKLRSGKMLRYQRSAFDE